MKYTLDQLELIAIMFKVQFGDKTFKELFPDLEHTRHERKINELDIVRINNEASFMLGRTVCAFFGLYLNGLYIFNDLPGTIAYHTKIENVINMLNFKDKI